MSTRWIVKAALAALLVFAAGCSTVQTTAPGAVGVDRKQQMLLSSEQIDQAAAQAYAQELAKARLPFVSLLTDPTRVSSIAIRSRWSACGASPTG